MWQEPAVRSAARDDAGLDGVTRTVRGRSLAQCVDKLDCAPTERPPVTRVKLSTALLMAAPQLETVLDAAHPVPPLVEEDVKALKYLGSSGYFTLKKSASMYAGVKRLRQARK